MAIITSAISTINQFSEDERLMALHFMVVGAFVVTWRFWFSSCAAVVGIGMAQLLLLYCVDAAVFHVFVFVLTWNPVFCNLVLRLLQRSAGSSSAILGIVFAWIVLDQSLLLHFATCGTSFEMGTHIIIPFSVMVGIFINILLCCMQLAVVYCLLCYNEDNEVKNNLVMMIDNCFWDWKIATVTTAALIAAWSYIYIHIYVSLIQPGDGPFVALLGPLLPAPSRFSYSCVSLMIVGHCGIMGYIYCICNGLLLEDEKAKKKKNPKAKKQLDQGKTYTAEDIVKASRKKLLLQCRGGALVSPKPDVLWACYRRIRDLDTAELLKGGYIEMLVASIDIHQDDSQRLLQLLSWFGARGGILMRHDDGDGGSQCRDRLITAGLLPRLARFLDTCKHTERDVLFRTLAALITFVYEASGEHMEAAATLIPSVIAAMKRAGNCGAIQVAGDRPTSTRHPFH